MPLIPITLNLISRKYTKFLFVKKIAVGFFKYFFESIS